MPIMNEHFESRATLAGSPDEVFAYVDDPAHLAGHMVKRSWLGRAFGRAYARWCTERMVSDAVRHFTTRKEPQ